MDVEQVHEAGEDQRHRQLLLPFRCPRDRGSVVAGIGVDGHHHGNVPALYRARFRYQA